LWQSIAGQRNSFITQQPAAPRYSAPSRDQSRWCRRASDNGWNVSRVVLWRLRRYQLKLASFCTCQPVTSGYSARRRDVYLQILRKAQARADQRQWLRCSGCWCVCFVQLHTCSSLRSMRTACQNVARPACVQHQNTDSVPCDIMQSMDTPGGDDGTALPRHGSLP
jgi:hypothetical protein